MKRIIETNDLEDLEESIIIALAEYKGTKEGFYKRLLKVINEAEKNYNSNEINNLNSYIGYRKSFGEKTEIWENQIKEYEKQQNDFPYKIGYRRYTDESFDKLKKIIEKFNIKTVFKQENEHSKIFYKNAFEVWQKMWDKRKVTVKSRADLSFMYEVMKGKRLIHDTITQTIMEKWISDTYLIDFIDKLQFTDPKQHSNRYRMSDFIDILENTKV